MTEIYRKPEMGVQPNIAAMHDDPGLSRFTSLLDAHARMVDDSTEGPVIQMTEALEKLTNLLSGASDQALARAAAQLVGEVQMHLQFQDIVRQQVNVVRFGLLALSQANAPLAAKDCDDWIEDQIKQLEATYVMQDQWNIHNTHLGLEIEEDDEDDDMVFF